MDGTLDVSNTAFSECVQTDTTFLPIASPAEVLAAEQRSNKPHTSSPSDTARSFHNTSRKYSASAGSSHSMDGKAILNVGGVRHEGYVFDLISHCIKQLVYF